MNYLAHAMLSPADDLVMVGNLVGDFVRSLDDLPPRLRQGVVLHRRIDSAANEHPAFRHSTHRLVPAVGHYARAVLDIFYDHILARDFEDFSVSGTLEAFVESIDRRYCAQRLHLPSDLASRWSTVTWLASYAHTDGVARSLRRLSQRSRRDVDLTMAMPLLEQHYSALRDDLAELFPALEAVVRNQTELVG
jgi:acyl carrier protein phosphodiesterase